MTLLLRYLLNNFPIKLQCVVIVTTQLIVVKTSKKPKAYISHFYAYFILSLYIKLNNYNYCTVQKIIDIKKWIVN